jgi:hypothetical protein
VIASSDEIAARPDAKPKAAPSLWERRTNWFRIAEFEASLFCFLAATGLLLFAELTDTAGAHRWMLHIASEPAWIVGLYAMSGLILLAALSRPGLLRSSCLMVGITFFSGVQLIGLGVIGEYLGRVFTEVKRRPLFLVAETVGFEPLAPAVLDRPGSSDLFPA